MDYLQYSGAMVYWIAIVIGVLNLIINGLPSICITIKDRGKTIKSFKPYYKWITFNI